MKYENQDLYRTMTYLTADPIFRLANGVKYHEMHDDSGFIFRTLSNPDIAEYVIDQLISKGIDIHDFLIVTTSDWDRHKSIRNRYVTVESSIHGNQAWLKQLEPKGRNIEIGRGVKHSFSEEQNFDIGCFVQRRGLLTDDDPHKLYRIIDHDSSTDLMYLCTTKDDYGFYIANSTEFVGRYPTVKFNCDHIRSDTQHPDLLITKNDGSFCLY